MKTNRKKLLGGVLFLVVFTALPVHATDLTLFGGIQHPSEFTLDTVGGAITVDPRDFDMFGVRVSSGTILGSEHTLAYSPSFVSSQNSAFFYNSNLILHIPLGLVRPYGTVGLGTVYIGEDGGPLNVISGAKFAFNYGGGVRFHLKGPLGGQIDARGYSIHNIQNDSMRVLEVSLGLVLSF